MFLATGNKGKVGELIPLVKEYIPDVTEIVARAPREADEIENSFLGNAKIKADALAAELRREREAAPYFVLADDSGLEVRALGGRPGVHSARYAGDHAGAEANVKKLLGEMADESDRDCRYVCVLYLTRVLSDGSSKSWSTEGFCDGKIVTEARGSGGFGYDPVFFVPILNKRMSEATLDEKNSLSHRSRAFEKLKLL